LCIEKNPDSAMLLRSLPGRLYIDLPEAGINPDMPRLSVFRMQRSSQQQAMLVTGVLVCLANLPKNACINVPSSI